MKCRKKLQPRRRQTLDSSLRAKVSQVISFLGLSDFHASINSELLEDVKRKRKRKRKSLFSRGTVIIKAATQKFLLKSTDNPFELNLRTNFCDRGLAMIKPGRPIISALDIL